MEEKRKALKFKVKLEEKPTEEVKISGYAFDRRGNLLTMAPVVNGQVTLQLSADEAREARIFIGPSGEKREAGEYTLNMMARMRAYEPQWKYEASTSVHELEPVPALHSNYWFFVKCLVKGKVVKHITRDGIVYDMPVEHARVHICEVDPLFLIIPRLPEPQIFRLRDEFLKAIRKPFPRPPLPDPPPFRFDPGIMDPSPLIMAELNRETSVPELKESFSSGFMPNLQPALPGENDDAPSIPIEPVSAAELMSGSLEVVKNALIANAKLITPFLCWWPWLWPFYKYDEVAVVYSDHFGRFQKTLWYPSNGDHPDLYFWVEYCIGGAWETVYRPSVRCHTYWNYACGTTVTIHLTDPRVPWIEPPPSLPALQIGIMTIGNNISLSEIQSPSSGSGAGLTLQGEPMGGSLEPHVWFGDALISSGITHYRWSYRMIQQANGSPAIDVWHAIDRQVVRHYATVEPNPPYNLSFKPYLLGPDPTFPAANLIQIQPKNPPAGSLGWAPQVDARENSASAFFLSHLLSGGDAAAAAGKYELKLELFNSAGNLINITDKGILLRIPTIAAPFGPVTIPMIDAPAEYLIKNSAGKVIGFRMVLYVDNNPCEAMIYDARVNSQIAGPCGFIPYPSESDVTLSFRAYHRNRFARFRFTLVKGSSGPQQNYCAPSPSGGPWYTMPLSGDSPVNLYTVGTGGVYTRQISAHDLVHPCPGGKASFAETLYLWALATDGWNRLSYLDRSAVPKAFALEPQLASDPA